MVHVVIEFINKCSNNGKRHVSNKYSKLFFTTIQLGDIICIHTRNQFIATFLEANIHSKT